MNFKRITPILFAMAAFAWLAAGIVSSVAGETQVVSYAMSAVFAALGLIYHRQKRAKGE